MTVFQAIILGIIQGVTEFLPISSSAHLVIAPYLFGWTFPEEQIFIFDVLVQMGTLVAVVVYFWKDLIQIVVDFFQGLIKKVPFKTHESRMGWYLILATIPAGMAGILVKPLVETAFCNPVLVGTLLFITALLLISAEIFGKREKPLTSINWLDALVIGLGQAAAIFPGISRSGATIAPGLLRGLTRPAAARFSFLMSVPIMLAAGFMSLFDLMDIPGVMSFIPAVLAGTAAAAIVGYLSIHWLLKFMNRHSLFPFAVYCVLLGALTLVVSFIR